MFKVDIERKDKVNTYFVYDKEEFVQTVWHGPRSLMVIDNTIEKITDVIPCKEGLIYVIKNPTPVIVKKENLEKYFNDLIELLNPYIKNSEIDKALFTRITEDDYKRLKALADYQQKDSEEAKEQEEIKEDVESSWQLVRKYNPNYGYHTY